MPTAHVAGVRALGQRQVYECAGGDGGRAVLFHLRADPAREADFEVGRR